MTDYHSTMSTKPTILNKKTIATSRLFRIESDHDAMRKFKAGPRGGQNGNRRS